ncbi:MAG: hypothetical protein ACYDBT_02230 [Desulfobulbaceae bacterium]
MKANRRAAERLESVGLMTNLFDGRSAALGVVKDVSRCGMRVSTVPSGFEETVETCYAVVDGGWRNFHIALQPRWTLAAAGGMFKTIGFQIQHPPAEWTQFIEKMEYEQRSDMGLAA